jgi:maltooligosyltrehalose trehalohydrolase
MDFYRELIRLRKDTPALAKLSKKHQDVVGDPDQRMLFARRWNQSNEVFMVFSFNQQAVTVTMPVPPGVWQKYLDSAEHRWQGQGSSVPGEIESTGRIELSVAGRGVLLFGRNDRQGPDDGGQMTAERNWNSEVGMEKAESQRTKGGRRM